jgi:hypothetical protein
MRTRTGRIGRLPIEQEGLDARRHPFARHQQFAERSKEKIELPDRQREGGD